MRSAIKKLIALRSAYESIVHSNSCDHIPIIIIIIYNERMLGMTILEFEHTVTLNSTTILLK